MHVCVCVSVIEGEEKQWGREAYIVKNEGCVTADWFRDGIYGGGKREGKRGGREIERLKRACNMATQQCHNT